MRIFYYFFSPRIDGKAGHVRADENVFSCSATAYRATATRPRRSTSLAACSTAYAPGNLLLLGLQMLSYLGSMMQKIQAIFVFDTQKNTIFLTLVYVYYSK